MRMESMVLHPRRLRTLVFGWPGWRDSEARKVSPENALG